MIHVKRFQDFLSFLNESQKYHSMEIPSEGLKMDNDQVGTEEQIIKAMRKGISKYGKYFQFASQTSGLPVEMLIAFSACESMVGGNIGPVGHPTRGIMQWNRTYVKSVLENELSMGRMTEEEKTKLKEFGIVFDEKGKTRVITEADQLKPELNILIGSIIIGQLADSYLQGKSPDPNSWGTDNGKVRLDRIICVYNSGANGPTGKEARFGNHSTPYELSKKVNPISRSYIRRLMGEGGFYDLLVNKMKSDLSPYKSPIPPSPKQDKEDSEKEPIEIPNTKTVTPEGPEE
jgi:hypothetical protein